VSGRLQSHWPSASQTTFGSVKFSIADSPACAVKRGRPRQLKWRDFSVDSSEKNF
jgi:hypothetical protein